MVKQGMVILDREELKRLLKYDPNSGQFTWKVKKGRKNVGDAAGCFYGKHRYHCIKLNQILYQSHRLAYLYMEGYIPDCVDHIDGDPSNNKWCNLREATLSQNQWNRKISINCTSGIKGVSFHKRANKWRAIIGVSGKSIHLGYYATKEEAEEALRLKREDLHLGFHRHK